VVVKGDVELGTWTSYGYDAVGRMPILPLALHNQGIVDHELMTTCTFQGEEPQQFMLQITLQIAHCDALFSVSITM
jgi:hypothetical protein